MDAGQVVESGSHGELLAIDRLYARLSKEQFSDGIVEAKCADGVTCPPATSSRSSRWTMTCCAGGMILSVCEAGFLRARRAGCRLGLAGGG
jgi:hypothetical protein